jgi:hypothetical protein
MTSHQHTALGAAIEAARQAYVFAANSYSFDAFLSVIALRDHLERPDWIECYRELEPESEADEMCEAAE